MAKAPNDDDLVNEIEQIRGRLADTVDELIGRAHPKTIASRSLGNVKARFVADDGSPKLDSIVPIVGGAIAVVASLIVIRRIFR